MRITAQPIVSSLTEQRASAAMEASDLLLEAGVHPAALREACDGAFIRRLDVVCGRVVAGVDAKKGDLTKARAWLEERCQEAGLAIRVQAAPASECCRAGCAGCLVGPGEAPELREIWLKTKG